MPKNATAVPEEFPVTLDEFLGGLGHRQIEINTAFAKLVKTSGPSHRTRKEWADLLELFHKKPMTIAWDKWIDQNKKGGK